MTEKAIDKLAKFFEEMNSSINIMKTIYFDRVIETEAEMLEDDVYNEIFSGFVNEDKGFRKRNPVAEFTAYVSGEKIFTAYTIQGMRMFKEVTLGCTLSNSPFHSVVIEDDGAFIIERNWDKSMENRTRIKHMGYRVWSN